MTATNKGHEDMVKKLISSVETIGASLRSIDPSKMTTAQVSKLSAAAEKVAALEAAAKDIKTHP